jgi:exopolysaccharide biosynthesis predicted pyruvyltransferase EpsI
MGEFLNITANATRSIQDGIVCANPDAMLMNGLWRKKTELSKFALTTYFVQSIFFILLSRLFGIILSPLHQPPFVCDVLVSFYIIHSLLVSNYVMTYDNNMN